MGRGPGVALTLLDVFRMGTSFSALILASKSSHARPEFWKRILSPKGWGREQAEDGDRRAPHRPSQATPPATERPTPSPTGHEGKLRPGAGPGLVAPASSLCACHGEGWEEGGAGHLGACACRRPARSWLTGACLYPCPGPRLGVHQAAVAPWPLPRGGVGLWDDSLHLLSEVLRVLADGLGQLGHRVQHEVIEDHLWGPGRQHGARCPGGPAPPRPEGLPGRGAPASSRFRGRVLLASASSQRSFLFWSRSRGPREPGGTFWKLRLASGMRCTSCRGWEQGSGPRPPRHGQNRPQRQLLGVPGLPSPRKASPGPGDLRAVRVPVESSQPRPPSPVCEGRGRGCQGPGSPPRGQRWWRQECWARC